MIVTYSMLVIAQVQALRNTGDERGELGLEDKG